MRKALWKKGYRYKKNYKDLPGKPDIVLTKYRIAIFCDGEFFHGKNWNELKDKLRGSEHSDFWIGKISRNIERDNKVDRQLHQLGWTVIRFLGDEIKKDINGCIQTIEDTIIEFKINNLQ